MSVWEPSDSELEAAQYRASGYSQLRTSQHCNLTERQIQRYDADPRFRGLVLKLRADMMANLEPKLGALMTDAIEVLQEAMAGRLKGDDPRVILARNISRDTAFRLLRLRAAERLRAGGDAAIIDEAEPA